MATPTPPVNTYVAGFSGSVTEITEPTTLPIKGTIPSWLHGAVYRVCCVLSLQDCSERVLVYQQCPITFATALTNT